MNALELHDITGKRNCNEEVWVYVKPDSEHISVWARLLKVSQRRPGDDVLIIEAERSPNGPDIAKPVMLTISELETLQVNLSRTPGDLLRKVNAELALRRMV